MAPPGFPASLSPSRASDFLTCPLLFRYRSIDRLPERPSAAALRGTLVHAALERLFDDAPAGRTFERAVERLAAAWGALAQDDPEAAAVLLEEAGLQADADADEVAASVLAPAEPLLRAYFALEDPKAFEPHARELGVSVDIAEGFSIRGFIDRIDKAPGGEIRIVDYKTGRAPGPAFEAKAMFQMRFYALAWWRMTGELPRLLQLLYLGSGERLRYEPDEADLLGTERKILAVRDAIARAAEKGDFPPSPSRLCEWCDHRGLCPAWGGTPPPLPADDTWGAATSPADLIGGDAPDEGD